MPASRRKKKKIKDSGDDEHELAEDDNNNKSTPSSPSKGTNNHDVLSSSTTTTTTAAALVGPTTGGTGVSSASSFSSGSSSGGLSRFGLQRKRRVLSGLFGVLLVAYVAYFCYLRWDDEGQLSSGSGVSEVYQVLWLCNLSLIFGAVGMLLQNPQLIGTAVGCVAFSHMSWTFDVFYWILFDTFQIGRAKYLEEKEFDRLWSMTLHQFWFIPLCLTVLHVDYNGFGIKMISWLHTLPIYAVMSTIAFFEFVRPVEQRSLPQTYVYDFNTGHEFYDIDACNVVHMFDTSVFPIYILWSIFIQGVVLNGICFLFLKLVSLLLLEDLQTEHVVTGKEVKQIYK